MIETIEEKNKWIDLLHTLSKDELVNFIMNDSFDDIKTAELLQLRFGFRYCGDNIDKLIDYYSRYVEAYAYCKNPDIGHIERMTWILIDLADTAYINHRKRILNEVRNMMESLSLDGIGMKNDDDFRFYIISEHVDKLLEK